MCGVYCFLPSWAVCSSLACLAATSLSLKKYLSIFYFSCDATCQHVAQGMTNLFLHNWLPCHTTSTMLNQAYSIFSWRNLNTIHHVHVPSSSNTIYFSQNYLSPLRYCPHEWELPSLTFWITINLTKSGLLYVLKSTVVATVQWHNCDHNSQVLRTGRSCD